MCDCNRKACDYFCSNIYRNRFYRKRTKQISTMTETSRQTAKQRSRDQTRDPDTPSSDIESLTFTQEERSSVSSSRFTFFPKRKFSHQKDAKREGSVKERPKKLEIKSRSYSSLICSLHEDDTSTITDNTYTTSTATVVKCCSSSKKSASKKSTGGGSLLSCTACTTSPNTSPDNSSSCDLMTSSNRYVTSSPDKMPPSIVVIPESVRKLSDYKF